MLILNAGFHPLGCDTYTYNLGSVSSEILLKLDLAVVPNIWDIFPVSPPFKLVTPCAQFTQSSLYLRDKSRSS